MKNLLIALLLTTAFAHPAAAQPPSASHLQAATEVLQALNLEQTMMGGAAAMAEAMTQQNPALAPYRDVILKWAGSFATWDVFGPRMVRLYADAYTESELRELLLFYKTPVGQKAVALMPELARKGALLGSEVATEHAAELDRMLRQRAAELAAKP